MSDLLHEDALVAITRRDRFLVGAFKRPHRVLSTSIIGGGMREDCAQVVNHQSCEPSGHDAAMQVWRKHGPAGSHRLSCEAIGIDPERTALCGTAANMGCAALARIEHAELAVTVVATAGVEGNATRAGDPASWHETPGGCEQVRPSPHHGTIVHLAFINAPCSAGCLVKAATMLTEAKSCAVLDLRVPSRQGAGLATGTGTDQFALCAPLAQDGEWERRFAGSHNTLGEILCQAVHQATSRALELQNGLLPSLRRSVLVALGRHGVNLDGLLVVAELVLDPAAATLLRKNQMSVLHDPLTAATAHALANIVDAHASGILDPGTRAEAIVNHAAQLACVVARKPEGFAAFRQRLFELDDRSLPGFVHHALAWGFAERWRHLDA